MKPMEFLLEFLNQNYYMMVPALWVIGYGLKQTPKIPNWTILWILLVISISFGTFAFGFSSEGILNGVIAAGVAVLGHQMFKQTVTSRREKQEIINAAKVLENNLLKEEENKKQVTAEKKEEDNHPL